METGSELTTASVGHRRRAAVLGVGLSLVLIAAAMLTGAFLRGLLADLATRPRSAVADAVPVVALVVVVVGLAWLAFVVAVSSHDLVRRRDRSRHPRSGRAGAPFAARVAAALLAATACGSAGATAQALTAPAAAVSVETMRAPADHRAEHGRTLAPPGLPVPDFAPPVGVPDSTERPDPARCDLPAPGWTSSSPRLQRSASTDQAGLLDRCGAAPSGAELVVHRGDSLWSIVARDLGPDASAAEVAAAWPTWYAANRTLIGPDPDVLLPGTTLHRPTQEVLR